MKPEFDDVLLTAYLDDEVSDWERALVEEQLRTSESSRKLLEELRSVRNLVVQLHLSQPSRSFQQGPWSDANETQQSYNVQSTKVASSKVVVNDKHIVLSVPFQRLASLAALIAIAACVSFLVWRPNRGSMSLTENSGPKGELATSARDGFEVTPTDSPAMAPIESMSPVAPTPPIISSEEASRSAMPQKATKSQPTLGEAEGRVSKESLGRPAMASGSLKEGMERTLEESASSTGRHSTPSSGGTPGAGGAGGFGGAAASKPMTKQKADTADVKRVEPTPTAAGKLAESIPPAPATPPFDMAQAPELSAQFVPTDFRLFESLLQKQADGEGDWLALDDSSKNASLGVEVAQSTELEARYFFRFRGPETDEYKKSLDAIAKTEKQTVSRDPIKLNLESSLMEKEEEPNSMVVELQVPVEEWARGAKRLRLMGIDVPLELPDAEYLDFTANRIPKNASGLADNATNNSPVNRFEVDAKASNATPELGWVIRSLELSRNQLATGSAGGKAAASSAEELGRIQSADKIRIRVRVIRKK